MFIQKNTASRIIREISTVLNYDINIMNEQGVIIASTNPDRIDGFHEGAYKIINENLSELLVYYDGEYQGCLKGINLPILVDGQIVGVIGMTGEVDEITPYGRILKKMTEILVLDISNLHQRSIEDHNKMYFINGIVTNTIDYSNIKKYIKKFGFNEHNPFSCFIFMPPSLMEKYEIKDTITINNGNIGIAITQRNTEKLKIHLQQISETEENSSFYLSDTDGDAEALHKLYSNAENIYEYCNSSNIESDSNIFCYDDHLINIKLFNMPDKDKENCINHVFRDCNTEEKISYAKFIEIYSKCNGSINRIAEQLYIHKNTVQYKINKIYAKTGYDMRKSEDLFKLSLAAKLLKYQ